MTREPRLRCENVSWRAAETMVLEGATLDARAGEIVALLGANGAGKTTLLRILHLLKRPDAGRVLLDGAPIDNASAARLAAIRRFGLVQQTPGLLRIPAWANVAFPLRARGQPRRAAEAHARSLIDAAGLASRSDAFPHQLSGGEIQRVALARAIVTRPDVLLLDEPANQLDPESLLRVEAMVHEERERGAAIVLVTHSLAQTRRLADRIAFLDAGRVVEEGPASEVLGNARTPRLQRFLDLA